MTTRVKEWFGFAQANALCRTLVHFFPSAGNVTAPYPSRCSLGIFGAGVEPKEITVEGARLSQPDGIWLDDVFPELREGMPGFLGLHVQVSTGQPRIDLSHSRCMVELTSQVQSMSYQPAEEIVDHGSALQSGLFTFDSYQHCSLVVMNLSMESSIIGLHARQPNTGEELFQEEIITEAVSVKEYALEEEKYKDCTPRECSWGLSRSIVGSLDFSRAERSLCYLLYREAQTKRPLAVRRI